MTECLISKESLVVSHSCKRLKIISHFLCDERRTDNVDGVPCCSFLLKYRIFVDRFGQLCPIQIFIQHFMFDFQNQLHRSPLALNKMRKKRVPFVCRESRRCGNITFSKDYSTMSFQRPRCAFVPRLPQPSEREDHFLQQAFCSQ